CGYVPSPARSYVVLGWIGGATAPVAASGARPAWTASVSSLIVVSFPGVVEASMAGYWPAALTAASGRVCLPEHSRARGRARAERDEQNAVAGGDASLLDRLVKRHGHRGGAHVAVPVDVDVDALGRHAQLAAERLDDAEVRLVRDDEGDVVFPDARALQRPLRLRRHRAHRGAEQPRALHAQQMPALCEHALVERPERAAARAHQRGRQPPVRPPARAQHAEPGALR